jgi:Leucine-rich repeat (LRR) protein
MVSSLIELDTLSVDRNKLTSLTGIRPLTNLTRLRAGNNQLTSISIISSLTELYELSVHNNKLRSIITIHALHKLFLPTRGFVDDNNYTKNQLVPIDKLNLIKYMEKNKVNIYNYWQLCRKFPRHFKFTIFHILKDLLIVSFKDELIKNIYIRNYHFKN